MGIGTNPGIGMNYCYSIGFWLGSPTAPGGSIPGIPAAIGGIMGKPAGMPGIAAYGF